MQDLALSVLNLDYPMVAIGIDPGQTTGVAVYLIEAEDKLPVQQQTLQWSDPDTVWQKMLKMKQTYQEFGIKHVVFVIEQFDKRPGVADPDFTPRFIIKDIERYLPEHTRVYQTPSQAKNLVKPAKAGAPDGLKRFGWYVVGMGHANDASRHVITFLVEKVKHMPTILKGWPRRGDH